jgi:hypothetical protein
MHSISFLSRFVFDEFIAKGESLCTNLAELLLIMINVYLRGRACLESVRGSLVQGQFLNLWVELFFAFFFVCRFSCHLLVLRLFPLLDDLLELFFSFRSFSCASWSLGFEIQTLYFLLSMYLSRGKLRNQVASTLVWLWWVMGMSRFEFKSGAFPWFYYYLSYVENRVCWSHGV